VKCSERDCYSSIFLHRAPYIMYAMETQQPLCCMTLNDDLLLHMNFVEIANFLRQTKIPKFYISFKNPNPVDLELLIDVLIENTAIRSLDFSFAHFGRNGYVQLIRLLREKRCLDELNFDRPCVPTYLGRFASVLQAIRENHSLPPVQMYIDEINVVCLQMIEDMNRESSNPRIIMRRNNPQVYKKIWDEEYYD
jgi:hypothetical protein